jgi:hypothetical protein
VVVLLLLVLQQRPMTILPVQAANNIGDHRCCYNDVDDDDVVDDADVAADVDVDEDDYYSDDYDDDYKDNSVAVAVAVE